MQPPFFSALHALAIDDGGGRAGFSFALLPTRHIKHVMDAIQRAVIAPQVEIVEKCAARRQIFRDRTPLASRSSLRAPRHGACCRRAWRAGSMVRHAPIHRRSGHSDIAICCGRNVRGSSPSTSVPLSNQVTPLNHKRLKGFKMFSDGHSVPGDMHVCLFDLCNEQEATLTCSTIFIWPRAVERRFGPTMFIKFW